MDNAIDERKMITKYAIKHLICSKERVMTILFLANVTVF